MVDSFEELHASLVSSDKKLVRGNADNTLLNKPVVKNSFSKNLAGHQESFFRFNINDASNEESVIFDLILPVY